MDFLSILESLSNENEKDFQNHFYPHFSNEEINTKVLEILKIDFPKDLNIYFLGRKTTPIKMQPLVKKLFNFAPKKINQPFYISQGHWGKILGIKQQTLSDYISRLKKLGVLICLDEKNTFEGEKTEIKYLNCFDFQGYCKYYLCNKDKCKMLLDYCNSQIDNNKKVCKTNVKDNIINTENLSSNFDLERKYFGLNRNQIESMINELNKDLPDYEQMTLNEEKEFSRIYCPFCSLPTEKHFSEKRLAMEKENHFTFTREMYLSSFEKKYIDWDRKASVPFITRLVNFGIITPNDYDLYNDLNGAPFESMEERNAYKSFFMRLYFSKSKKQCIAQSIRAWNEWFYGVQTNKGRKQPILYKWLKNTDDIMIDDRNKKHLRNAISMYHLCIKKAYKENPKITKHEQEKLIENYVNEKYDLVEKVLGKRLGNSVFMYESSLYLQVRNIAKQEKIEMKQCYDCFYYPEDSSFDVMEKISQIVGNLS